jgi:hypothetical protein
MDVISVSDKTGHNKEKRSKKFRMIASIFFSSQIFHSLLVLLKLFSFPSVINYNTHIFRFDWGKKDENVIVDRIDPFVLGCLQPIEAK